MSFLDHFTTFDTGRWTSVTAGSGTVTTTDSECVMTCPTAATDAAFIYLDTKIDKTKNQIYLFNFKLSNITIVAGRWWLFGIYNHASAPTAGLYGTLEPDVRIKASIGYNATSGYGLEFSRYSTSHARTTWEIATNTWITPPGITVYAVNPVVSNSYMTLGLETRSSPSQSWRMIGGGISPASYQFDQGLVMNALTDWTDWTFHETTTDLWLTIGERFTDYYSENGRMEWFRYADGTRIDAWTNRKDTSATAWTIRRYYSFDGEFFINEDRTTDAIPLGAATTWDDSDTKDKTVIKDGSTYYMYYAGNDGSNWQIGLATNTGEPPTGAWTKDANNPLIVRSAGHENSVFAPFVVKDESAPSGERWKVFYSGYSSTDSKWRIFCKYAATPTATTWTKVLGGGTANSILDVGGASAPDEDGCSNPVVFWNNGQWEVWYSGQSAGATSWTVCRAYGTDLTSLTKDTANNPYIPKEVDAKENLSGAISGTTWPVASTTGFVADALVHIDDTTRSSGDDYGCSKIRKVNAGTSLEVHHIITGFTTGSSAHIRQGDAGVVTIHAIVDKGSEWWFYVTIFNFFRSHTFNHCYSETTGILSSTNLTDTTKTWKWIATPCIHKDSYGPNRRSNENIALVNLPTTTGAAVPLAGLIATTSALTGDLSVDHSLAGVVAGASTITGNIGVNRGIAGAAAATSTLTGALSVNRSIAGTIAGASTLTGDLTVLGSVPLAGTVAATSALSGLLSLSLSISGTAAATSSLTGNLTLDASLAGSVAGTSALTGALTVTPSGIVPLAGVVAAASTVTGGVGVTRGIAGSVDAVSTLAGALVMDWAIAGVVAGSSTLTGALTVTGPTIVTLSGTIAGTSSLTGSVIADLSLAGTAPGAATLTGSLTITGLFKSGVEYVFKVPLTPVSFEVELMGNLCDQIITLTPNENRVFDFDFTNKLKTGETLTGTPTFTIVPTETIGSATASGVLAQGRIDTWATGEYLVTCKCGTTDSQIVEAAGIILVEEAG